METRTDLHGATNIIPLLLIVHSSHRITCLRLSRGQTNCLLHTSNFITISQSQASISMTLILRVSTRASLSRKKWLEKTTSRMVAGTQSMSLHATWRKLPKWAIVWFQLSWSLSRQSRNRSAKWILREVLQRVLRKPTICQTISALIKM